MHSINFFNLNNFRTRTFLKIVLSIQISMWGAIGLDLIGIQIPLLRQIIGFLYLTFLPGIIISRLLKIRSTFIEYCLYCIGLSLSFLMFIGFFMNNFCSSFGVEKPISMMPLIITLSFFILFFSICAFIIERKFPLAEVPVTSKCQFMNMPPKALFIFFLIPFLSIFGTYLLNIYHLNFMLSLLIIILSLTPLVVISDQLNKETYPLLLFLISISLLYHTSLNSMYLWGRDIFNEFYISNMVISNSVWNPVWHDNTNALLSITVLPAIYCFICNINLIWIFKVIYPFIFSLSTVSLYLVYRDQVGEKIAFLSCFFFVSIYTYYAEMPQLARQEIAVFFLSLILLLLLDTSCAKIKKVVILLIFSMSLTVSHYGTVLLFLFALVISQLYFIFESVYLKSLRFRYNIHAPKFESKAFSVNKELSMNYVLFFITFVFAWFIYISDTPFITVVGLFNLMISSILGGFLSPTSTEAVGIMLKSQSPIITLTKYLHLMSQFFISIGIATVVMGYFKKSINKRYLALSIINFGYCLAALIVPYFALALTTPRLYHLSVIFLAPFCLIGGIMFLSLFKIEIKRTLFLLTIFLGIFLLFNSGFIGEFTNDQTSISLSSDLDWPRYTQQEYLCANWLSYNKNESIFGYGDTYRWVLLGGFDWDRSDDIEKSLQLPTKRCYIFLGSMNVHEKKMLLGGGRYSNGEYLEYNDLINDKNKIYSNEGAEIYYL